MQGYFDRNVTDRDRAVFEAGIAIGSLYHQFLGVPITGETKVLKALERAIKLTMMSQPYREALAVKIRKTGGRKRHPYDYESLKGRHLDIEITCRYGNYKVMSVMKYIPEMDYNFMYIGKIERVR